MVDLIPRLKRSGIVVDLLLFNGKETPFKKVAQENGIRIFDLGIGGSYYSPKKLLRLIPFLRRYDVVHTHNTAPQLFAAIGNLLGNAKLVTTEHSTSNRRREWRWFKGVDRWMYNRYSKVICISKKAEDNLREHIGTSKAEILTINNGVDTAKFTDAVPCGDLERIAPGSRKLIMVAAFRWEKDQPTIIRALQELPDNFHLFLVGDGTRRGELNDLSAKLGVAKRVHFLGIRSDIPQLLHAADYVIMSSHFEGLSLSSVEGMSVGKPFIASDVDGLREVVNGAGVLFLHEDYSALTRAILELEDDSAKYKEVAKQCAERAKEYDIAKMAEGYANLYKSLHF